MSRDFAKERPGYNDTFSQELCVLFIAAGVEEDELDSADVLLRGIQVWLDWVRINTLWLREVKKPVGFWCVSIPYALMVRGAGEGPSD